VVRAIVVRRCCLAMMCTGMALRYARHARTPRAGQRPVQGCSSAARRREITPDHLRGATCFMGRNSPVVLLPLSSSARNRDSRPRARRAPLSAPNSFTIFQISSRRRTRDRRPRSFWPGESRLASSARCSRVCQSRAPPKRTVSRPAAVTRYVSGRCDTSNAEL